MKELASFNANIFGVLESDDTLRPSVEIVIILSEPGYKPSADSAQFEKHRDFSTFRFCASPIALVAMADAMHELAVKATERFPTKQQ